MRANLKDRRRNPNRKPDPDAFLFLRERVWEADRGTAGSIAGALMEQLDADTFESVARVLGWCERCQGTGFVSGHPVEECGDVPCGGCR